MSCLRYCLTSSIEAMMEECIFLLVVAILALSCITSCWVSMKLECKVLKPIGRNDTYECEMICMNVIREKREIQWNRYQIMVPTISNFSFNS